MKVPFRQDNLCRMFKAAALALPVFATITPVAQAEEDIGTVLQNRNIPYHEFAKPPETTLPRGQYAYAVHLEESHKSYTDASKLMMRHAPAAAYSMYYGAMSVSGKDIKVEAYDMNPFIGGPLGKENDGEGMNRSIMQYMLDNATAISISMNTNSHHRIAISREDIPALYQQWKDSHAIMTQSAGNGGNSCNIGDTHPLTQQEFTFPQLADTYAKTGSATIDPVTGEIMIKQSSSCSGADLIGLNPYLTGLEFRFRPTEEEFTALYSEFAATANGGMGSLETALEKLRAKRARDLNEEGYMTNIGGNSFVAPYSGGYFAGAEEICPALTEYDILGTAFAHAVPVRAIDGIDFPYDDNGRIPYDDVRGGFGYIGEEVYKEAIRQACETLAQHPELATREVQIEQHFDNLQPVTTDLPDGKEAVEFEITETVLPFRIIMEIESSEGGVPYSMTLVSPDGAQVNLKPANANWQSPSWGLAATNGFFGTETKGTWKLVFDQNKSITSAVIRISAVEHGGLVDNIINQSVKREANEPAPHYTSR